MQSRTLLIIFFMYLFFCAEILNMRIYHKTHNLYTKCIYINCAGFAYHLIKNAIYLDVL